MPPESRISDFEARLALARSPSYNDDALGDAIKERQTLLVEKPDNEEIHLELAWRGLWLQPNPKHEYRNYEIIRILNIEQEVDRL